jgi:hypothetical protein
LWSSFFSKRLCSRELIYGEVNFFISLQALSQEYCILDCKKMTRKVNFTPFLLLQVPILTGLRIFFRVEIAERAAR